jgi:Flp pilus assembly protein TadG
MKMKQVKRFGSSERGATLVEFALALTVLLTSMFGVVEFGRVLWTHNALTDAARRGARYATLHTAAEVANVKNVVVYGDEAGGTQPVVPNLTTGNVTVNYTDIGVNKGSVSVGITGYQFQFVIPVVGTTITMPAYSTTLTGESTGVIPPNK